MSENIYLHTMLFLSIFAILCLCMVLACFLITIDPVMSILILIIILMVISYIIIFYLEV